VAKLVVDPRTGRVVVDHLDPFGRRKRPSFPDTAEGRRRAQTMLTIALNQERRETTVDPDIVVKDYACLWLDEVRASVKIGPCPTTRCSTTNA